MKNAPNGYRPTIPDAVRKNIAAFTPEQVYFFARYACALFDGYEPPPPPNGTDPLLCRVVCGEIDERQAYIDDVCRRRAESGRIGGKSKSRQVLASVANATFATSKGEERKGEKSKGESVGVAEQPGAHTRTRDSEGGGAERKQRATAKDKARPKDAAEVAAYAKSIGYDLDAERFMDYYEAQGWKQGNGQPLKDWKAAVRLWQRRDQERGEEKREADTPKRDIRDLI